MLMYFDLQMNVVVFLYDPKPRKLLYLGYRQMTRQGFCSYFLCRGVIIDGLSRDSNPR